MAAYDFDMWSRAAREISRSFDQWGSPASLVESLRPESPVLHVYAQPRDDSFLAAQQAFAKENPWFEVRRLDASTHFPMFEVPGDLVSAIEAFVSEKC